MFKYFARALSTAAVVGTLTVLAVGCATGGASDEAPNSVVGDWGSVTKGQPYLSFTVEGAVLGSDGCNGITSSYTIESDQVVIDRFATTLKACQGVDTWLSGLASVSVEGDTLVVKNAAGTQIGQLQRS